MSTNVFLFFVGVSSHRISLDGVGGVDEDEEGEGVLGGAWRLILAVSHAIVG